MVIISTIIYGALIALGGIMGFVMAGSLPSLIAGGVLGVGLIISGILIRKGHPSGLRFAWALTVLVAGNFIYLVIKAFLTDASLGRGIAVLSLSAVQIFILARHGRNNGTVQD